MPKCKHCNVKFKQRWIGDKFCLTSDECIDAATLFTKTEKERLFKSKCVTDRREYKAKNKTYTQKVNEAKLVFQKWVRLVKDKGKNCISCGSNSDQKDGGHYLKAEVYSGLIFDERNCSSQCRKCNRFLNGNELNYRDGLIKRYGKEFVEQLESEKDAKRVYKWSDEELENIKQKYKL